MSHWTSLTAQIKNPDPQLLRQVLQIIAQELGAREVAENFVVRGWGASVRCQFAIPLSLPYGNGYGVLISEDGTLKVVVDDHGAPLTARQFLEKLQQYYTAFAVIQAGKELGFSINVQQTGDSIIVDLMA